MRILKQTLAVWAFGALVLARSGAAQVEGGTGAFKWYVGGHGGITSFRTPIEGREFMPVAGGHLLVTAKRTGLLLTVDQAFGSDQATATLFEVRDSADNVVDFGAENWTFDGIRRYSAILMAYPVRNPNIQPFVGVGGGIAHTTGNSPGPFADRNVEDELSSTGFATAVAGLEFRLGPFSAFGMYQVTTKQGFKRAMNVLQVDAQGQPTLVRLDYGEWTLGANHTVTGGLRFSLGGARESVKSGGY